MDYQLYRLLSLFKHILCATAEHALILKQNPHDRKLPSDHVIPVLC